MNILDLPIEKQKKHAEEEGMSYEDWLEETKQMLEGAKKHSEKIETIHLTGKEAEEYLKEHGNFYDRITGAVG